MTIDFDCGCQACHDPEQGAFVVTSMCDQHEEMYGTEDEEDGE